MATRPKNALFLALSAALLAFFALQGPYAWPAESFKITDIKMASIMSEQFMPVNPADTFPKGTQRVYCWFRWTGADKNAQIIAKWSYASKNMSIIEHAFALSQKNGSGSILLSMPKKKILPSGSYRIDLSTKEHILKSCKFNIE